MSPTYPLASLVDFTAVPADMFLNSAMAIVPFPIPCRVPVM